MNNPSCPACGKTMSLSSSLSLSGVVQDWLCPDRTCTGILTVEQADRVAGRIAYESYLGAPVEDLMKAPVTPQLGGSGGTKGRRNPKPGDRERPERRPEQGQPVGGRDRSIQVDKLGLHLQGRVRKDQEAVYRAWCAANPGKTQSDFLREAVDRLIRDEGQDEGRSA